MAIMSHMIGRHRQCIANLQCSLHAADVMNLLTMLAVTFYQPYYNNSCYITY